MDKVILITLSALLSLCITVSAFASEQPAGSDMSSQYDIDLQPGHHRIIINAPARRIVRIYNERPQTVSVEAASNLAVPFVRINIEKPSLSPPLQLINAL